MTKDELISKQQLEIENLKLTMQINRNLVRNLKMKFVAIGQPLNDNVLMMNGSQLNWCQSVLDLIESIETDEPEAP